MAGLALVAAALWLIVLLLPWRSWSTHERIEPGEPSGDSCVKASRAVTVLIPARNEATTIRQALASVLVQPDVAGVVVVDDQSSDGTAAVVASVADENPEVRLIEGRPAPPGWSGKLWAQQQGMAEIDSSLVLLIDADIRLARGMLRALVEKLEGDCLAQASVMASLPVSSWPERLMLPAFVYFFKQLYPFAWVNRADRPFAAAAGGCVLIRREYLEKTGAFEAWKSTLIDDCELASRVRGVGGHIWLGLSHGVESMRRHPDLASIMETVRRTAYTQLRHSRLVLLAVAAVMLCAFAVPPIATFLGLVTAQPLVTLCGLTGWLTMTLTFVPQVRFSGLGAHWALTLPLAAMLFLAATVDSAVRHHFGAGAGWKDRRYER